MSHTANDVVACLVERRIVPNVDGGVALIAALAAHVKEALTVVRLGVGRVPLPDHGCIVSIPGVISWVRQPTVSSHPQPLDCRFDQTWLDLKGLRQLRAPYPAPASLRKKEVNFREIVSLTGDLFRSHDAAKTAVLKFFDIVAEFATRGEASRVAIPFPTLGVLFAERGAFGFTFADDRLTNLPPSSLGLTREALENGMGRPASQCGSAFSAARGSRPPSSRGSIAASESISAYPASLSVSRSNAATPTSFRRPNSAALARVMDSACQREVQSRQFDRHTDAVIETSAVNRNDVAALASVSHMKRKRLEAYEMLRQLESQIQDKRERERSYHQYVHTPDPLHFPFSDQSRAAERTRLLARDNLHVNKAIARSRESSSRDAVRQDIAAEALSIERERDEAARRFIAAKSAQRQAREQLESAWKVQLHLKHTPALL